ncbi:hypothetical protein VF14_25465 [Nostoc linckia z18]|jgi:hypothetical protein|uniref:Uncharacterized protein n=2 Tax=Nostoc linckia TaxID=92942 RepID=A0A9Q5Z901_NOSLI|nr:hypothetical protein [Nostoc linckia]PHK27889.1 hypothetical protein VF12_33980 [Nostoc linckia z15]PHK44331.1 hypothetical protein VF13_22645 [Nostoc linckia z16]PHJ56432.1 hypothetical protein VF03_37610 [Nostoc linckia z2]PHJ58663.1 hypothetical protein VF05_33505 [Nostoc linckia z3]PHJ62811.1 hypothetical protein VF02_16825 [Nostoc linckia z1]
MTNIPEPVWIKELNKFVLREYPKLPNFLNCSIAYFDEEDSEEFCFSFGSWGMDREEITEEMCLLCCQALLDADANVSFCSFKSDLEYAQNYFYELEDESEE